MKNIILILVLLLLVSCSHFQRAMMAMQGNPFTEAEMSGARPGELYAAHCARCHGGSGLGDGPESKALTASMPNFSDGSYQKSLGMTAANIKYGKREEMPAFKNRLADREIWALAQYLHAFND